jgi:hypothetical protein
MKKFLSYMILATVIYVLIYAILLGSLRMQSAHISDYCENVQNGETVPEILARAKGKDLISAFQDVAENNIRILFVSEPDNKDAVCKIMIENEVVTQKKFVLSVF